MTPCPPFHGKLLARFLYDMFMNLDGDVPQRLGANATASFLEIYGEDVYDLLGDAHAPGTKRTSLQVSLVRNLDIIILGSGALLLG